MLVPRQTGRAIAQMSIADSDHFHNGSAEPSGDDAGDADRERNRGKRDQCGPSIVRSKTIEEPPNERIRGDREQRDEDQQPGAVNERVALTDCGGDRRLIDTMELRDLTGERGQTLFAVRTYSSPPA
jgi:hypothetical protein